MCIILWCPIFTGIHLKFEVSVSLAQIFSYLFTADTCAFVQRFVTMCRSGVYKGVDENKTEMLQHLQSVRVSPYRDYNVISGVGVWCQVEVRVYDKKVPGVRMALVAGNINSVWPPLCWEWWEWMTRTHTHGNLASQCHWRLRRWPVSTRDNSRYDIREA